MYTGPVPPAPCHFSTIWASEVHSPSPIRAGQLGRTGPNAETIDRDVVLGRVVEAGVLDGSSRPSWSTVVTGPQRRTTSTASSSMSMRSGAVGQRSPKMCSLRASPVPTPHEKRPSKSWRRSRGGLGQDRRVDAHDRARDAHGDVDRRRALGDRAEHATRRTANDPAPSIHGWKWSEMDAKSKPWSSAMPARSTRRRGGCSSLESVSPNFVGAMVRVTPPAGSAYAPAA